MILIRRCYLVSLLFNQKFNDGSLGLIDGLLLFNLGSLFLYLLNLGLKDSELLIENFVIRYCEGQFVFLVALLFFLKSSEGIDDHCQNKVHHYE